MRVQIQVYVRKISILRMNIRMNGDDLACSDGMLLTSLEH